MKAPASVCKMPTTNSLGLPNRLFIALFFLLFIAQSAFSQASGTHFSSRKAGWWTFGLDGGLAYQSSDVRNTFEGWGAGMTLGKNLYYRPGAALSFDMRGRLLFTQSVGADALRSFGIGKNNVLNGTNDAGLNYIRDLSAPNDSSFVFQNYRNRMGELALEGVFTFNRFRERTGVVLSLFGGIGLDVYNTRINQLDASNNTYNYFAINPSDSRKSILTELDALRDQTYETDADGFDNVLKVGLMPAVGIELGYQVAPRFVVGLGHKLTFSRTDVLDGQRWSNSNAATGDNDLHHYTSLHLRWDIQPRERRQEPPIIKIIDPSTDPYISSSSNTFLRANIKNVGSAADINCTINGSNQYFDFKNQNLGASLRLRPGRNEVRIVASNTAGRAEETVTIVWEDRNYPPPPPPPPPADPIVERPTVNITSPARSPYTTDRDNINIIANIKGVRERRSIRLLVNGAEQTNFSLAESLEAAVRLNEGRNTIRVEAENRDGRASDEVEVIYKREETAKRPVVTITNPRNRSESTNEKTFPLRATVDNVDSKDGITVLFNGTTVRDFSFNTRTREVTASLPLKSGDNDVTIRAKNNAGEGEASALLTLIGGVSMPKKPAVTITEPANNTSTADARATLKANVKNIADASEISVLVNGTKIGGVDFNKVAQTIAVRVDLKEGDNTLTVKAVNKDGADEETVKVRYEKQKNPPSVTITEPANNAKTGSSFTTLRANAKNIADASEISVLVNGTKIGGADFNKAAQTITVRVDLKEGDNNLTVKAVNKDGADEASVKVRYEKVKNPPTVTITEPANNSKAASSFATLRANVKNVADASEISVLVNGIKIGGLDFNKAAQTIAVRVDLKEGDNTLTVKAVNKDGADEASVRVRYEKEKNPPSVTITEPKNGAKMSENQTTLKATLKNINDAAEITVMVNGTKLLRFDFNKAAQSLSAPINLNEGDNTIKVQAANRDGSDESTVTVRYEKIKRMPTVTIAAPKNKATTDQAQVVLTAKLENVFDDKLVQVLHNGTAIKNWTLDRGGNLASTITLADGKNTLVVKASNPDGKAEAAVEVTYTPKTLAAKPSIEFKSPKRNGQVVKKPVYNVQAIVKGIAGKNQIAVAINGKAPRNVEYDATTNIVSFPATLADGKNTITIEATNESGKATAETFINYEKTAKPAPDVSIVSASTPTVSPFDPNTGKSSVIAKAENVDSKDQIKVKVNGVNFTDFTFNKDTDIVQFVVNLKKGDNIVEITATTPDGTDSASTTVKFQ